MFTELFSVSKRMDSQQQEQKYLGIQQFYAGKTYAMTGGTGFLGQALIEKMLRSCPNIEHILIFIREKKGVCPDDRLHKLWKEPVSLSSLLMCL